jgi:hypothetical protein
MAYSVADVFDCFTNFPSGFAEAFFYFTAGVVGATFSFEFLVVDGPADCFFSFAFSLIQFSFYFVSIR